jgi:pyocin large subunit-like protein
MEGKMRKMMTSAAVVAVLAALAACDNGARATAAQAPTARAERSAPASSANLTEVAWAPSRTRSAGEAAQVQFEKNGSALGATSVDDYVAAARAFIAHPPKGAERLERPNGDVLIYDAASNRFAVATAEGAPRTLFKPREGAAYWAEQKARANGASKTSAKPKEAHAKARYATDEG